MSRMNKAVLIISLVLSMACSLQGKVLFLAHWNESFKADHAGGSAMPVAIGGSNRPEIKGGYPFTDSMPGINGLTINEGSMLGYQTKGNMNLNCGTIDMWFFQKKPFKGGPYNPMLFTTNTAPGQDVSWHNRMFLQYGGWHQQVHFQIVDGDGKWRSGVTALVDDWVAGTWHKITVSWSKPRQRLTLYIDGKLADQKPSKIFPSKLNPIFYIGSLCGWKGFMPGGYDELRILDREITPLEAAVDFCKTKEYSADDSFRPEDLMLPIDISKQATRPFEDDKPADKKGGWTDQGSTNDMKNMVRGRVVVKGIPFEIPNGCIALANRTRPYLKKSATIPIDKKLGGLLFINTAAWQQAQNKVCANYAVKYSDGSEVTVPVITFNNIGDWWYGQDMINSMPVLPTKAAGTTVYSYLWYWKNPSPDKKILSVTFASTQDQALPILIAITGIKPSAPAVVYKALNVLTRIAPNLDKKFNARVKKYDESLARLPEVEQKIKSCTPTSTQLKSFYGRQMQRYVTNSLVYVKEIHKLDPRIKDACDKKEYHQIRLLEKSLTYMSYLDNYLKKISNAAKQANSAEIMQPIKPQPAKFSEIKGVDFSKAERADIVLNGVWARADAANYDMPPAIDKFQPEIIPETWSNPLAKDSWFRRVIAIPAEWKGKSFALHFESATDLVEVYVNRHFVGRHIATHPFTCDLKDYLKVGYENEILILVAMGGAINDIPAGGNTMFNWADHSGINQDLTLQVRPAVYMDDLFAYLLSKDKIRLSGKIMNGTSANYSADISIDLPDGKAKDFGEIEIFPVADGSFAVDLNWQNPLLWGIGGKYGKPNLVDVNVTLADKNKTLDVASFRTGFRMIEVRGTQFYLNGHHIIFQGDSLWDRGTGCSTRGFNLQYMKLARNANFNIVRYHWLDGADAYSAQLEAGDQMGYMIEPEGDPFKVPLLITGDRNYDDPILRINARKYYKSVAEKFRNHPSVVIYSLCNEVFQGEGAWIPDAIKFFLNMETQVARILPCVLLTEQGNAAREEFSIADVHYWQGGDSFEAWKKTAKKPIIHGEWAFYESGYFPMNSPHKAEALMAMKSAAKSFEREVIKERKAGVAGTMPFPALRIYGFCMADRSLMGPWGDKIPINDKKGNNWFLPYHSGTKVDIPWPASSGRGAKPAKIGAGTHSANVNYFDPNRKIFTPNDVYYAFKRGYAPMPPINDIVDPEVMVNIGDNNGVYPVWSITPNKTSWLGVLPDKQGTAWFAPVMPGEHTWAYSNAEVGESGTQSVKPLKIGLPGFEYINEIELKK